MAALSLFCATPLLLHLVAALCVECPRRRTLYSRAPLPCAGQWDAARALVHRGAPQDFSALPLRFVNSARGVPAFIGTEMEQPRNGTELYRCGWSQRTKRHCEHYF